MASENWQATFEHPHLSCSLQESTLLGAVGELNPSKNLQLQISSRHPAIAAFLKQVLTLAIQTAPIWVPLLFAAQTPPPLPPPVHPPPPSS